MGCRLGSLWRHDVVADLMPSMYKTLGDLMPSNIRAAISYHAHSRLAGITEAVSISSTDATGRPWPAGGQREKRFGKSAPR